jgi:hypothetical protein
MKVEFSRNKLDNDWWFTIGISYQKTEFHDTYQKVFTIDLGFWTIYIRWDIKQQKRK